MKKALSLFLALMLCVGIFAVPAFAEDDYGPLTIHNAIIGEGTFEFSAAKVETISENEYGANKKVTLKSGSTVKISASEYSDFASISGRTDELEIMGINLDFSLNPGTYPVEELFRQRQNMYGWVGPFDSLVFMSLASSEGSDHYDLTISYTVVLDVPTKHEVQRSAQSVTVDGKAVTPGIYNIDGSNYFKLRDLAVLLNGTDAQFEVSYDETTKTISITTGKAYTPVGGELEVGEDLSSTYVKNIQTVKIDDFEPPLAAYNIGGNNYFKLRDLGNYLGFGVDYDEATNTAVITTK